MVCKQGWDGDEVRHYFFKFIFIKTRFILAKSISAFPFSHYKPERTILLLLRVCQTTESENKRLRVERNSIFLNRIYWKNLFSNYTYEVNTMNLRISIKEVYVTYCFWWPLFESLWVGWFWLFFLLTRLTFWSFLLVCLQMYCVQMKGWITCLLSFLFKRKLKVSVRAVDLWGSLNAAAYFMFCSWWLVMLLTWRHEFGLS